MPIYEFKCERCGARKEKLQRMSDPAPACDEVDHGPMTKLISPSNFELKGGGWARDGYGGGNSGG